jgi:hypothetical protein
MENMDKKKVLFYGTGTMLLLVGLGAIAAGMAMVLEPDGSGLQMSLNLLKDSPFEDFLIPGITLLAINGIGSLIVAVLLFIKHHLTEKAVIILGTLMIIWIFAQVFWIGWQSWLQPTFLMVGIVEICLGYFIHQMNHEDGGIFRGHHHDSHAH